MRKFVLNDVIKLRRRIYLELARALLEERLKEVLPALPKMLIPEDKYENKMELYYEREIVKDKLKIALGLNYQKVRDKELYELLPTLDDILSGNSELIDKENFITVIDKACQVCPAGKMYVTDLCRNCLAHFCVSVCPRKAITFSEGRAKIDYSKCVNCGLCATACPYKAIVKLERPCELACVPKAIEEAGESVRINREKCVLCGSCLIACPFGAIESPSYLLQVLSALERGEKLIAIYAPSAVAQFGIKVSVKQFRQALKRLGFSEVYEVAMGADMVAREEAEMLLERGGPMLTSCCPAYVNFIRSKYPELESKISPAPSPMIAISKYLRDKYPESKLVFIGPCIAKKEEATRLGLPDWVLTFEEIGSAFVAYKIEPMNLEEDEIKGGTPCGWNFAYSGGVTEAVKYYLRELGGEEKVNSFRYYHADGLKECDDALKALKQRKLSVDLLEGMGCEGGCVAGPGVLIDPKIAAATLKRVFNLRGV